MKFKVGDKVKILNCRHDNDHIGESGPITELEDYEGEYGVRTTVGICYANKIELVSKVGRPKKEKPHQFIAIYDEADGDPHELFYTKKALVKWIEEAWDDDDIVNDSIRVHKLDHEMVVSRAVKINVRKKRT